MGRRAATVIATFLVVTSWSTLALQLYLTVNANLSIGNSLLIGVVRNFSFFTVLTNTLAAIVLTAWVWPSRTRSWLSSPSVRAATVAYMVMVGIVYSLILRHTWDPQGLQKLADIVLHDIMPPAFALYWLVFWRTGTLHWSRVPSWLAYPLLYLGYSLLHGSMTGWYPYLFLDAGALGYERVILVATVFTLAFAVLGVIVVALDRVYPSTAGMPVSEH